MHLRPLCNQKPFVWKQDSFGGADGRLAGLCVYFRLTKPQRARTLCSGRVVFTKIFSEGTCQVQTSRCRHCGRLHAATYLVSLGPFYSPLTTENSGRSLIRKLKTLPWAYSPALSSKWGSDRTDPFKSKSVSLIPILTTGEHGGESSKFSRRLDGI